MSGFGEGEGELLTLSYPKPLPMRLDRWLVAQRLLDDFRRGVLGPIALELPRQP